MVNKTAEVRNASTDPKPGIPPPESGRGRGRPLEKVTVNLTQRSSRALTETAQRTGDSKTDTINRALQLYALFDEVLANGGAVYLRTAPDAELERLRMF